MSVNRIGTNYDAIVIGSGLGGLTSGALYAKEGRRVLVLERHDKFGGAATIFERKKMEIEVGLQALDGMDADDLKINLWHKLGIADRLTTIPLKTLYCVHCPKLGRDFVMPVGVDRAIDAVVKRFPQHEKGIKRYFKVLLGIRKAVKLFESRYNRKIWWLINGPLFPIRFWPLIRYERKTLGEFLQALFGNDELVKLALCANIGYYTDDINKLSFLYFAAAQGSFHKGGGHYIYGGSQSLSDYLVNIIRSVGGEALVSRRATKILVENGQAVGVEYEKSAIIGSKIEVKNPSPKQAFAPVIFGNASPHILKILLPARYQNDFMRPYQDIPISTSLWIIFLGLDRKPSEFGVSHYSTFIFLESFNSLQDCTKNAELMRSTPGKTISEFVFVDYSSFDTGLKSEDLCFAVMCGIDRLSNWESLDEASYERHKSMWLNAYITKLDETYPGIAESIVYKEMATARTVRDYLNTPKGAVYGFAQEPPYSGRHRPKSKTTIKGLFLASAFASPGGGFTGAMLSGENAWRCAVKRA